MGIDRRLLALSALLLVACMSTPSPAQTLTTVYDFCAQPNCTDGAWPDAGLVQGTDGYLYGTTSQVPGTVFRTTPDGALTTLHTFSGTDGANPIAELVQANDGNFYGTTFNGGANNDASCIAGGFVGCGTVFKITPGGSLTTVYNFCSQQHCRDGSNPSAGLVQGADGNLYGTANGLTGGTVYKITPAGGMVSLYHFCSQSNCADGEFPRSLVQGSDGNFYGTTYAGGTGSNCTGQNSMGCGTVFKVTPQGMLTTLYSFNNADGCYPEAGLVRGTDGNLYGTTSGGGPQGYCGSPVPAGGTVFKVSTAGVLSTLYDFCSQSNCSDGEYPDGKLVQATDGNFYGTTNGGGHAPGYGTIFKITSNGAFTSLYDFCSLANCADGILPYGAVIQATDGSIYGTTYEDGTNGQGTIYRFSLGLASSPVQFVPVTPCRLVDTRTQNGGGGPIQGGTFQSFNLPQLASGKGCADLSIAAAYSLNVTVVPHGGLGYLTIWPAGANQPVVSTMNSLDGRIKANAAIVQGGVNQGVSVYVSDTSDVVLDIDGYFAASGSTLQFYPLPPCRVLDTRNPDGELGGPYLKSKEERDFPVLSSDCNIPSSAEAYSMNFTVVPYQGQPLGYLTVWPQGGTQPTVSTLNNLTATIVANAAIVPAGTGGGIAAYPSGNTQLVADIDGYFAPASSGGLSLYPVAPCRVIDTRKGSGQFSGELTVNVVGSPCAPPSDAQAYVFNATVVPVGSLGYLTLWPDTENQPLVSTLNALDGAITSNMAIVPNINGTIDAYASGTTQLVLDISSYFAP